MPFRKLLDEGGEGSSSVPESRCEKVERSVCCQ